jgi:hypothetical protein
MSEQTPSPKEVLASLISSFSAAEVSGDPILRNYARQNLQTMLQRYELVEIKEPEAEVED